MSYPLLASSLYQKVLIEPASFADKLCIVSGFATSAMADRHLKALTKNFPDHKSTVELVIGMTPQQGIKKTDHANFVQLMDSNINNFSCSYVEQLPAIHSKLYVWLKDETPVRSFCGSANYTQNAFFNSNQAEILTECCPVSSFQYFLQVSNNNLVYCNHPDAELLCSEENIKNNTEDVNIEYPQGLETLELPLYIVKENRIHDKGGLNWGQRKGREPNQAYIPIPIAKARSGFFPPSGQHISILTTDNKPIPFTCSIAQSKQKGSNIGCAIESTNNSLLGSYFREKLGVALGSKVELADLDRFGNRNVTFIKIDDETYYMDFSPILD